MTLKKIALTTFFFFIGLVTFSQSKSLVGAYGNNNQYGHFFQIILKKDSSFVYYINSHVYGKDVVKGTWHFQPDTLYLDISLPKSKETVIVKEKIPNKSIQTLRFYLVSRDTSIIANAKVLIDNKIELITDSLGCIQYHSPIHQLNIEYEDLLSDTVFSIYSSENNNLDFYIPLLTYPPLTHQQPNKWLTDHKKLIPVTKVNGINSIHKNQSIKRICKRKVVEELKAEVKRPG